MSCYPHPYTALGEFEAAFGGTAPDRPTLPDNPPLRDLRVRLLQEEFEEYLLAEKNNDLVEIADALADLVYIAFGTAITYGLPLDEIFAEVHRSNMAKLDNGRVIRRADGKVQKPISWTPPDIAGIVTRERGAAALADTIRASGIPATYIMAKLRGDRWP